MGKTNYAVAVHDAVYWTVNRVVYRAVDGAVEGAVEGAVHNAKDSDHPAFQDFLREVRP